MVINLKRINRSKDEKTPKSDRGPNKDSKDPFLLYPYKSITWKI